MLSASDFVDYRPSCSWPLVFTAPHGGNFCPEEVPDRKDGCMEVDWGSYELAQEVLRAFGEGTEGPPALVALKLVRPKLDANRSRADAARASREAACAWDAYHGSIEEALQKCVERFGFCLLLDIHGQSHRKGITELGYLATVGDLAQTDDALAARPRPTSIDAFLSGPPTPSRTLSPSNLLNRVLPLRGSASKAESSPTGEGADLSALVRGPNSLGGLLERSGFPCTPSPAFPSPGDRQDIPYFHGAYTTRRYGCCRTVPHGANPLPDEAQTNWASRVAGIQLELSWVGVREHDDARCQFAKALRASLESFLQTWKGWSPAPRL